MGLLIGALTLGFIFSLVALGVFISFRIFAFPDITADGSSTLGAAGARAASSRQLVDRKRFNRLAGTSGGRDSSVIPENLRGSATNSQGSSSCRGRFGLYNSFDVTSSLSLSVRSRHGTRSAV